MLPSHPPYALEATSFPFPAVAALVGRAPLGGPREVALGVFLAARLANDTLPERGVPQLGRAERASSARTWLSTLTLPATVRSALSRLIESTAAEPRTVAGSVRELLGAAADFLDPRARLELERLVAALERA